MSAEARARLFVALELPDRVRDALMGWREHLPSAVAQTLRPIAAEAIHVTLCFLGWWPEGDVEAIGAACRVIAAEPSAPLVVQGAVWLPPRRPRVLAVKLADPEGKLTRAQARLSEALAAGGWYRPEKRPFLAHATVARVKSAPVTSRSRITDPPPLSFDASRVILYRSRLARTGAHYEALSAVELAG